MSKKSKPLPTTSSPSSDQTPAPLKPIADAVAPFNAMVISATQHQHIQQGGLIPPPAVMREWEEILPGAADRLLKIAEAETAHRRETELEAVKIQGRDQIAYRRSEMAGQVFGLLIGVAAIGGSVYLGTHGAQWSSGFLGTFGIGGLVAVFVLGRDQLNRQQKIDYARQLELVKKQKAALDRTRTETPAPQPPNANSST